MPAKKDLTGQRFGRLVVLKEALPIGGRITWHCRCDCGNEKDIKGICLTRSTQPTRSCGCLQREKTSETNRKEDLTGKVFGRLTVLQRDAESAKWICKCSCGNITKVTTTHLKSGHTKSCGCLQKDIASDTHAIDLTGQRFGMLTVVTKDFERSTSQRVFWICRCDCGNLKSICTGDLQTHGTISCGCSKISRGEYKIAELLSQAKIPFETEKTFPDCINPKTNRQLRFDFFVSGKYLIEFDGEQHFTQKFDEPLKDIQDRDKYKNQWCKIHNIPLIRIPYTKLNSLTLKDLLI